MSDAERHRLLYGFNDTAAKTPSASVPELFARQVRANPDAVAVAAGGTELTYAELGLRADRLAGALIRQGVRPETPVAVLMDRSAELVVAILAIVKAGGAYVPLDSRFPSSRIDLIMRESGAALVLTPELLAALMRSAAADPYEADVVCEPGQVAYIMYTSGSTGRPKGVAVTHEDVVGLALTPEWRGGGHERVLMHSPTAFDLSTYELWVPLLNGGRVVVAPPEQLDLDLLQHTITTHGVTGLWLTAGLFRLVAEERPGLLAGVREVWTGGDVVSPPPSRGCSRPAPASRWSTATGRPKRPPWPPVTLCATFPRTPRPCRSAGRWRTCAPTCSTTDCGRFRRAWSVSCTSRGRAWPAATSAAPA